ncbi:MAG: 50S ribosomal protein L31 [Rickettsia endosymbiont of Bryobia graminum]|nr:50S ribosomal protein L31 [Rickettsia endosymbiont of Bryobia graminum]
MREGIHPKYKKLKIVISSDTFETNSGGSLDEILMDVDYRKHPAWTKEAGNIVNQSNKNISDFNKKFAGLTFGKK